MRFYLSEHTTVTMLAKTACPQIDMSPSTANARTSGLISHLGKIVKVLQQEQRHDSEN